MSTDSPTPLDADSTATLRALSTATITTVLLKKGLRNVWMRGARPLRPGQPRRVGRAFTMRFVPAREDLAAGPEQERLEAWILAEVGRGAGLIGLYPPDEVALARYRSQCGFPTRA